MSRKLPDRFERTDNKATYVTAMDPGINLEAYGQLAVKIGVNLQEGQRLLIIGPLANGGVSLEAAPLIRHIAASAYRAGAPLVETLWGDEQLVLARFRYGPRVSFSEHSAWLTTTLTEHVKAGGAVLSVYANDPDLLKQEDPTLVSSLQQTTARSSQPFRDLISRNETNWAVVAGACASWADTVFPNAPAAERISRLWDAIGRLCRLDRPDPVGAWHDHLETLAARSAQLTEKRFDALRYTGPGTDLTIGFPPGHVWVSGRSVSRSGILFTANLPTEEVFTMPHRDRVQGTVASSKPLAYAGTLIDRFCLRFEDGRIVNVAAERGETVLRRLIDTDPGAARLGEVALVPHSSPISRSGVMFYNTLFDENAASHLAIGSAYKFTLTAGERMTDAEFESAGGNRSATHVDFMIGSGDLDVDGIRRDGSAEPIMRRGEWAD